MKSSLALVAFAVLALPPTQRSQAATDPAQESLEARIAAVARAVLDRGEAQGLALAVAMGGDELFAGAWGVEDAAAGARMRSTSSVPVGNLCEPLVSVLVLRLIEQGELAPDDRLSDRLPGLGAWSRDVRLEHLLAHTSGIPLVPALPVREEETSPEAWTAAVVASLAGAAPTFEPGSCLEYSNADALLLGLIVERARGRSVAAALHEDLFEPLGLRATSFAAPGRPPARERGPATLEVAGSAAEDPCPERPFGADDLCSNAPDLVALMRGLAERRAIGERGWTLLTTPARLRDGTALRMGLGATLGRVGEHERVSFGGAAGGCRSHVSYFPDAELVIAVLARGADAPADRVAASVARIVLGLLEPGMRDLSVPPELRAAYAGVYAIGCDRHVVEVRGDRVVLVPPQREEMPLVFQGEHRFVVEWDHDVEVRFQVADGRADSFVLYDHGYEAVARRME